MQPARLAGEDAAGHVVVLTNTADDWYDVLLPFILEGFAQGDRAIHVVEPGRRDEHLERLGKTGIDVEATTASGDLVVWTWNDGYLRGGSFAPVAQLAFLREMLGEGQNLGYPRTRFIGCSEWAIGDAEVMRKLVAYEREVDDMVENLPDVLVCTYDLSRHNARVIADVLGVHTTAVVGGIVRTSRPPERESPRERLITTASKLFHETGIQATGVHAILQAAGVAKATFYRHFPSKDDLVVAWLRDPRTRWFDRVMSQARSRGSDPIEVLARFFNGLGDWLEAGGYRGCPYLNIAVEITDPKHPALNVVREYLQEAEDDLAGLATDAGYREPRRLASQLQALIAGSISLAVARRNAGSAIAARDAALALVRESQRD